MTIIAKERQKEEPITSFLEQLTSKTRKALAVIFGITTDEALSNLGVQPIANEQWALFKSMIGKKDLKEINLFMLSCEDYQIRRELERGKAIIEYHETIRSSTWDSGERNKHRILRVDRLAEEVTIQNYCDNQPLSSISLFPDREWIDSYFGLVERIRWDKKQADNFYGTMDAPRQESLIKYADKSQITCLWIERLPLMIGMDAKVNKLIQLSEMRF